MVAQKIIERKGHHDDIALIIERSPVGKRVDVLFGIFQEIEVGVGGCCLEPFSLAYVRVFGQQDDYVYTSWSNDRQRFVQNKMMQGIDRPYYFNGLCCGFNFGFTPLFDLIGVVERYIAIRMVAFCFLLVKLENTRKCSNVFVSDEQPKNDKKNL